MRSRSWLAIDRLRSLNLNVLRQLLPVSRLCLLPPIDTTPIATDQLPHTNNRPLLDYTFEVPRAPVVGLEPCLAIDDRQSFPRGRAGAIRSFLKQTLAMRQSLEIDHGLDDMQTADILWSVANSAVRTSQVKPTTHSLSVPEVETWTDDLDKLNSRVPTRQYELFLLG
jgi:hypothetical protein